MGWYILRRGVSQNLHPGSERLKDVYVAGHLVEQTDGVDTILASFAYDTNGTLTSVVLGNPNSGPRYYYAYDAQGNVVDVTDSSGTVVASYSYDAFGALTSSSENFPNGWSNPFRYDGAQGVRYDTETGLYWMSVRAYDPTLGRFLSHDPLGRLAAMGLNMQPYVYAGNNPVDNTDPSGLIIMGSNGEKAVRTSKGTKIITSAGNASGHFDKGGSRKKKGSGGGGSGGRSGQAVIRPSDSMPFCPVNEVCSEPGQVSGKDSLFSLIGYQGGQLIAVGKAGIEQLKQDLIQLQGIIDNVLGGKMAEEQAKYAIFCAILFARLGAWWTKGDSNGIWGWLGIGGLVGAWQGATVVNGRIGAVNDEFGEIYAAINNLHLSNDDVTTEFAVTLHVSASTLLNPDSIFIDPWITYQVGTGPADWVGPPCNGNCV